MGKIRLIMHVLVLMSMTMTSVFAAHLTPIVCLHKRDFLSPHLTSSNPRLTVLHSLLPSSTRRILMICNSSLCTSQEILPL